jgi:hypothetical protein
MYKKCVHLKTSCILSHFIFEVFPFTLDDPNLEAIKKGQKITMCQKCETDTPYIFLDPTLRTTLKANEELGEILIRRLHNDQRCIAEVEMRT